MEEWCKRVSSETGAAWKYARVNQPVFTASRWMSLADLITASRQAGTLAFLDKSAGDRPVDEAAGELPGNKGRA
jgi:hypothetical protein